MPASRLSAPLLATLSLVALIANPSYRFPVRDDGRVGAKELFAYAHVGFPDGVHCDTQGNVYAGVGDGIHVWNTSGTLLGKFYVGGTSANFAVSRDSGEKSGVERTKVARNRVGKLEGGD